MKKVLCVLIAVVFMAGIFTLPSYADSATIALSKSNVTVGTNVTVTLRYNAGFPMFGIDGTLTYNNAVLKYVSGGGNNTGSTVKIVEGLSGEKSVSYNVVFKTIAAGSGSLLFSAEAAGDDNQNQKGNAKSGAAVTVTELKPSTNNNLGSLKISDGTLTPAFKARTLNYTASVKYSTTKITVNANAAAGDANVAGVGTFALAVGDNTRAVTVTAASGDKKTYTIKIKRMTEEETAAAEAEERANNPLLFETEGGDRFIVPDVDKITAYEGFEVKTYESKGVQIGYLADNSGKYNLVWATDANGENGAFYNRETSGEYKKVNYLAVSNAIYIIEPFDDDINVSSNYVLSTQEVNGDTLDCYRYSDVALKNYCIFYCYANGTSDYYKYDVDSNTIEAEPDFLATVEETEAEVETPQKGNLLDRFNSLSTRAKILVILLALAGILIFVLIILIIIKAASGKKEDFEEEEATPAPDIPIIGYEEEPEPEVPAKALQEKPVAQEPAKAPVEEPAKEPAEALQEESAAEEQPAETSAEEPEEMPAEAPQDEPAAQEPEEMPAEAPQDEPAAQEPGETPAEEPEEEVVYDDDPEDEEFDTSEFIDMDADF